MKLNKKPTPFNLKSTVKEREKRVTYAMPTPPLFNLKFTVKAVNLLQRMTKIPVWIQLLVCVWIAFLVLCLCVYVFLYLFIEKCVLREILSISGSCAWDPLSL